MTWLSGVVSSEAAVYPHSRPEWMPSWWLNIRVHDDPVEMARVADRRNAARWGRGMSDPTNSPEQGDNLALGMFQPTYDLRYDADSPSPLPYLGVLRFVRENLGSFIVTHECGHVTTTLWRLWRRNPKVYLGNAPGGELEEKFLRLHGEVCSRVVDWLYEHHAYDGEA